MKILETERLVLSHLSETDAPFIFELLNSPTWIKYIGDRGIKTLENATSYIMDKVAPSYELNGFGLFLVTLKKGNVSIGICGLIKRDTLDDIDIGFAFLPQFSGLGYGYEAAAATLEYANVTLNLPRVVAITTLENSVSISLLKKIGLHIEKTFFMDGDPEELLYLGINF